MHTCTYIHTHAHTHISTIFPNSKPKVLYATTVLTNGPFAEVKHSGRVIPEFLYKIMVIVHDPDLKLSTSLVNGLESQLDHPETR